MGIGCIWFSLRIWSEKCAERIIQRTDAVYWAKTETASVGSFLWIGQPLVPAIPWLRSSSCTPFATLPLPEWEEAAHSNANIRTIWVSVRRTKPISMLNVVSILNIDHYSTSSVWWYSVSFLECWQSALSAGNYCWIIRNFSQWDSSRMRAQAKIQWRKPNFQSLSTARVGQHPRNWRSRLMRTQPNPRRIWSHELLVPILVGHSFNSPWRSIKSYTCFLLFHRLWRYLCCPIAIRHNDSTREGEIAVSWWRHYTGRLFR